MRVIIVGAGIGGLALARGLQQQGVQALVLERDTDLTRTVGHTLQLHSPAMRGLQEMLPTESLRGLYALAQGTWVETGYTVRDHQGRPLAQDRPSTGPDGVATDRVTLRLLLASGLGEGLRLGSEVIGHRIRHDGVVALLADGGEVRGDVLVAADGVGSDTAQTLAGRPTSSPTSLVGFSGRTAAGALDPGASELFGGGATIAVGPGGCGLYAGHHDPLDQDVVRSFYPLGLHPDPMYVWGSVMLEWAQTAPLAEMDGEALRDAVTEQLQMRQWSPDLLEMVARAQPESLSSLRFHASPSYAAGIAPWNPSAVTALGDAVHAMPPTGGKGASTAIRDAHVLYTELLAARRGACTVVEAVASYEEQMRVYAAQAVAESRRPPAWTRTGGTGPSTRWTPTPRDHSLAAAAVSWAHRGEREPVGA